VQAFSISPILNKQIIDGCFILLNTFIVIKPRIGVEGFTITNDENSIQIIGNASNDQKDGENNQ
jgi:hypothetical protein